MCDKRDIVKKLKETGFFIKRNTNHEQWFDGKTRISVPHHNKIHPRLTKEIMLQIKRALIARSINELPSM